MDCRQSRLAPARLEGSWRATMTVALDHVTRTLDGIDAIRDVSLELDRGTLSVLLGPTLSGKTSIMRLLAGLDKPGSGRVLVDGKDVIRDVSLELDRGTLSVLLGPTLSGKTSIMRL